MQEIIKRCLPTYKIVRKLGEGIFGEVFLVRDNLKDRAVKIVPFLVERSLTYKTAADLDTKISQDYHAVRTYYDQIKGEGVVDIYDFHLVDKHVSQSQAKAYLVILMAYCPENLLDHVINRYPVPSPWALKLTRELAHLTSRLCRHQADTFLITDLKPANFLIDTTDRLVIGDLGGIKRLSSISATAKAQFTPNWSAPEVVIRGERPSQQSVIFSFGMVTHFIWEGLPPFDDKDFLERLLLIKEKGIALTRDDTPEAIQHLIKACLEFEPENRPPDFEIILKVLDRRKTDSTAPLSPARAKVDTGAKTRQSAVSAPRYDAKTELLNMPTVSVTVSTPEPGDDWIEPVTGIEFVWVPGGTYQMGCGAWDQQGYQNESPVHRVSLFGFWLGRYTVTQGQWTHVMRSNPSYFKSGDAYPVEQVSWKDIQQYIQKLTELNKGQYAFQLPSEAQWEYAARNGGKPDIYAGGNDLDAYAWYIDNTDGKPQPVGTKAPNKLGLHDMSGNLWELCLDLYKDNAYSRHVLNNPVNTTGSSEGQRVRRGGCWFSLANACRCCSRRKTATDERNHNLGFRLVRLP